MVGPSRVGEATNAVPVFQFEKRDCWRLPITFQSEIYGFPTMYRPSIKESGDESLVTQ